MTRKAETLILLAVVSVIFALYGSFYSNTFLYDDSEQVLAQQPLESFDDLIRAGVTCFSSQTAQYY